MEKHVQKQNADKARCSAGLREGNVSPAAAANSKVFSKRNALIVEKI